MSDGQYIVPLIQGDSEIVSETIGREDGVIGQNEACDMISFFIKSHSSLTPFPTLLFSGSKGLGKTHLARKTAAALGRELVEVNCSTMNEEEDLLDAVLLKRVLGDKPKTILFDEAHGLSSKVTNALLSLLNPNDDNKNLFAFKNIIMEYDFTKLNFIFATTHAYRVFGPLVSRCEEIYFHTYSDKELLDILRFYAKGFTLSVNKKYRDDLAAACRGRARDAFKLAQNIKRVCVMQDTKRLTDKGWEILKSTFGIHSCGLTTQEVNLLNILRDFGPISCRNIAVKMGVDERNVEAELEVRPKEIGFIDSTPRGRVLTEKGKHYLSNQGGA